MDWYATSSLVLMHKDFTDLISPSQHATIEAYVHFYTAISYETLGQMAHNYSGKKIPLLHQAKDAFLSASMALPITYVADGPTTHDTNSSCASPTLSDGASTFTSSSTAATTPCYSTFPPHSGPVSEKRVSGSSVNDFNGNNATVSGIPVAASMSTDSAHSSQGSPAIGNQRNSSANTEDDDLTPKPLCIKKKPESIDIASTGISHRLSTYRPQPPHTGRRKTAVLPIISKNFASLANRTSFSSYLRQGAIDRYNNHLRTFCQQIRAHIVAVNNSINSTAELQRQHRVNQTKRYASFWSFAGPQTENGVDPKDQERKERIERLRDNGWLVRKEKRGFKGTQYYEDLCNKALAELTEPKGK